MKIALKKKEKVVTTEADEKPTGAVSRRWMMGLGAAAVGAGLATATPASAADDDPVLLGETNTADENTNVTTTAHDALQGFTSGDAGSHGVLGTATAGIGVEGETTAGAANGNAGVVGTDSSSVSGGYGVLGTSVDGVGVQGYITGSGSSGESGVAGQDLTGGGGHGVFGNSTKGVGVYGTVAEGDSGLIDGLQAGTVGNSATTDGVIGASSSNNGVRGVSSAAANAQPGYAGVYGTDNSGDVAGGYGVYGTSLAGVGVGGVSLGGVGVSGESLASYGVNAAGGLAPLLLGLSGTAGAPTSGTHQLGEIYVDSNGVMYKCVAAGTPGTWVPMYNVVPLSAPIRLLDTRPGHTAATNPGSPLVGGATAFSLQITAKSVGGVEVPSGAVGVIGTVTVVNPKAAGYLTLYPASDSTRPVTSNINYEANGPATANQVTSGLSSAGVLAIYAAGTTDVTFDAAAFIY